MVRAGRSTGDPPPPIFYFSPGPSRGRPRESSLEGHRGLSTRGRRSGRLNLSGSMCFPLLSLPPVLLPRFCPWVLLRSIIASSIALKTARLILTVFGLGYQYRRPPGVIRGSILVTGAARAQLRTQPRAAPGRDRHALSGIGGQNFTQYTLPPLLLFTHYGGTASLGGLGRILTKVRVFREFSGLFSQDKKVSSRH